MRQSKQKISELLRFPYLMAVTHLSKCGKWKLKSWLVIAITSDLPACLLSRLASSSIRRRSRRGNPDRKSLDCFTPFAMRARVS